MNLLFLLIFVIGQLIHFNYAENETTTLDYRLNSDVVPINYELELTPYFNNTESDKEPFTFDGSVIITIKPTRPDVREITLHQEELNISHIELTIKTRYMPLFQWSPQQLNINTKSYNNITNKYTIKLNEPLTFGRTYQLFFKYVGKLRTDMHGFYRSSYKEGNETK